MALIARESVVVRYGLARFIFGSGRTPEWDKANKDFHAQQKTCQMCGLPAGALGKPFDTNPGNQTMLEAHDVRPYHLLTTAQKHDYAFIKSNFVMLHWFEHRRLAHLGDPNCLMFQPKIRELADLIMAYQKQGTRQ